MVTKSKGKAKATKGKFTKAEENKHLKRIQEQIEKFRKDSEKENFIAPTEEQLREKLRRANSPMATFEAWGPAPPGGTVGYTIGIYNPDPFNQLVYAHVFVGSGNVVGDNGQFLLNVDARFPRLTQPPAFGLSLAPGASANLNFQINIPSTIEPSSYMGNTVIISFNYFGVGVLFERCGFVFEVT